MFFHSVSEIRKFSKNIGHSVYQIPFWPHSRNGGHFWGVGLTPFFTPFVRTVKTSQNQISWTAKVMTFGPYLLSRENGDFRGQKGGHFGDPTFPFYRLLHDFHGNLDIWRNLRPRKPFRQVIWHLDQPSFQLRRRWFDP